MAVEAGTYVIVSATKPTLALDLYGAWDTSGNRLQLYARHDGDAQQVRLLPYGENWYMQFILTGKCIDRRGAGTTNGTEIIQWDKNTGQAQNWRFVEDGNTVTVGGVEYPSYTIMHPTLEMALAVNGSIASGSKLQLYSANGADSQRWVLIPQNPIPDGTYKVFTPLKTTMMLDVASGSTAKGANVQIYSDNDTNAQKWVVTTDKTTGISKIANPVTGYVLDDYNASTDVGANIIMWEYHGGQGQQWVIDPDESRTVTINGEPVGLYRLLMKLGTNRAADVANGGTSLGTNVRLWSLNNSLAQVWGFIPSEYLADDLPVPSSLSVSLMPLGGGARKGNINNNDTVVSFPAGSYSVYPRFNSAGDKFQLRYRTRERTSDMDNADLGEWSAWKSIFDGSSSNNGWGDIWSENCKPIQHNNTNWAKALSGTLSTTETDLIEYQYEVRRFVSKWGKANGAAHGNSATTSFKVAIEPAISDISLTMTPAGLAVSYTSSLPRSENTIKVSCPELFEDHSETAALASDSIVIPYDELLTIPEDGSTYTVELSLTTVDGATSAIRYPASVSYDSEHGTGVDYSFGVNGAAVDFTLDGTGVVYLEVVRGHGNRLIPFETDENGKVTIIPPLNTPYTLYVVKGEVTGGGAWATKVLHMGAIETNAYHITSLDGTNDVTIELNEGEPPTFEPSYARDLSFATTTGRERNVATMGTTTVAKWNLAGVFYGTYNGTLLEYDKAFDIAAHMGFCIFRAPNTFWAQAAITASSYNMSRVNVHSASFSFKEIEI